MELPKITYVMLNATHACNLRCRYCFVHQQPQTMTLETAKDAAHFVMNNCSNGETPRLHFFGGEPTVCWESIIVPLTRYIREDLRVPFQLGMTTNGTLLNEDRIAFMQENHIGMLFSIDGVKAAQDYNRPFADGSGSFDALEKLIPIIAKEFSPTFRMTLLPETCSHLYESIQFAESSGFTSFFAVPNVFQEWGDEAWKTLTGEVRKYGDYYITCYEQGRKPLFFSTFEKMFQKIQEINVAVKNDTFRAGASAYKKCGLGISHFASVHPGGDIYACQEMTSSAGPDSIFWIGNIYTGVSQERREALAALFDAPSISGGNCDSCRIRRVCDGGCVANNYMATGNINTIAKPFCRWQQIVLEEAIRVARALGNNKDFIAHWWSPGK